MPLPTTSFTTRDGARIDFTSLGLGTAPLGNIFKPIPEPEAEATLEAAWEEGIRYYDTAPLYGRGIAETRLNRLLRPKPRDSFVLSTKVGRIMKRTTPRQDGRAHTKYFGTPAREVVYDYTRMTALCAPWNTPSSALGLDRFDVLVYSRHRSRDARHRSRCRKSICGTYSIPVSKPWMSCEQARRDKAPSEPASTWH